MTEIRVPQLPESVADATLVAWHKKPGDPINRDENLADLETDKVVLEVPAPAAGIVRELKVASGTVVRSGDVLAVIEETTQAASAGRAPAAAAAATPPAAASPAATLAGGAAAEPAREADKLSPAVRRLVEENQLDPGRIPATGRDGRLTKADVVGFLGQRSESASPVAVAPAAPVKAAAPAASAAAPAASAAAPAASAAAPGRGDRRVAMTRLRARIAQRMVEAQSTQALLTSFNEVDLGAVQELRARHRERFEAQHKVKLGFMSFFVKACVEALRRFPVVNASVDGADIVYHDRYDIGVAVSTDRGLVVPVVRDVDDKDFGALEREIAAYARRAREGQLAIEDLSGGTFTITNGGVFGSLMSTPIVNAPQSAILGMHKIQDRPMVVGGAIAIRPMMYIALTYDHRIIDGREAVQFLVTVKESLEDPGRLLLGI